MPFIATGGFQYIEGPVTLRQSTVSSLATFLKGAPVAFDVTSRTLIEANSASSWIAGIADHDAADSIGGPLAGVASYIVPTEETVFAAPVVTGQTVTTSQVYDIEKSGSNFRVDLTSQTSGKVVTIPIGTSGSALVSDQSIVFCQFLKDTIGPFASTASAKLS